MSRDRETGQGAELGEVLFGARVEVARERWKIAQEIGCYRYEEQDEDARILELWLGELPE